MFQPDLLKGKKILITGGGSGLGKAMGQRYCELGAELVICGRRQEVLDETAETFASELGAEVTTHSLDIRDADAVAAMIETIWRDGPLHGLVNNAAGNFISKTEDLSHRAVDAVLKHRAARQLLRDARLRQKMAGGGQSRDGYQHRDDLCVDGVGLCGAVGHGEGRRARHDAQPWPLNGAIGASASMPLRPVRFRLPGAWDRLMPKSGALADGLGASSVPLGRVGEYQELADLAVFLMADGSGYINGDVITIDGGEWLQGAGQFNFLRAMTDEDWAAMKPKKS